MKVFNIIFSVSVILWAWVLFSFFDVITHNNDPDPVYSAINVFSLLW